MCIVLCFFFFQVNLNVNYIIRFDIYGQGVDKDPKDVLKIDQKGIIWIQKPVDYEIFKILKVNADCVHFRLNAVVELHTMK